MNALEEVLKALEAAPDDIRLLQKAGELFQKRGDNKSAATYFARLAECYARDGYLLKAVALLRQVVKLDPGLIDLLPRVASLHDELGLEREASEYLLQARDAFVKAGRIKEALEVELRLTERDVVFTPRVIGRA